MPGIVAVSKAITLHRLASVPAPPFNICLSHLKGVKAPLGTPRGKRRSCVWVVVELKRGILLFQPWPKWRGSASALNLPSNDRS